MESYNDVNRFCVLIQDQSQTECRYYVSGQGRPGDRITCREFCEDFAGGTCVDGFNNPSNGDRSCNLDDRLGCNENYRDQICICALN